MRTGAPPGASTSPARLDPASGGRATPPGPGRLAAELGLRDSVDYTLARRATLADLGAGRTSPHDVCDAHPYLLRAARFHGEPSDRPCPVCRREPLTHVTYTYGDGFRSDANGRVRQTADLPELASTQVAFTVYVVEVCRGCGWNHLALSYVLGTAQD